jgi:hypothetical protein
MKSGETRPHKGHAELRSDVKSSLWSITVSLAITRLTARTLAAACTSCASFEAGSVCHSML